MTAQTNVPLALYQANLSLWLRTASLLQQGQQQWLEQSAQAVRDTAQELGDEVRQLQADQDWHTLAMLPGQAALRAFNRQAVGLQAVARANAARQAALVGGLQEAVAEWQQQAAQGRGGDGATARPADVFGDWVRGWSRLAAGTRQPDDAAATAAAKEAGRG